MFFALLTWIRNEKLDERNRELDQRTFEFDWIVYKISHEIRSDLAGVLGLLRCWLTKYYKKKV